jgi:hypothetical protein
VVHRDINETEALGQAARELAPSAKNSGSQVAVISWRPLRKGSLRGFANVRTRFLTFFDVAVHVSNGKAWASVASRPVIDPEGRHAIGSNGKKCYVPAVSWATADLRRQFSDAVVAALAAASIRLDGDEL